MQTLRNEKSGNDLGVRKGSQLVLALDAVSMFRQQVESNQVTLADVRKKVEGLEVWDALAGDNWIMLSDVLNILDEEGADAERRIEPQPSHPQEIIDLFLLRLARWLMPKKSAEEEVVDHSVADGWFKEQTEYLREKNEEGADAEGWISVEDRLPPEGEMVLTVCSCDADGSDATHCDFWLQYHDRENGWYPTLPTDDGCKKITHWQGLPKGPAAEEKL